MKIRKTEPSVGILGKIVNLFSNSTKDTYSCDYINNNAGLRKVSNMSYIDLTEPGIYLVDSPTMTDTISWGNTVTDIPFETILYVSSYEGSYEGSEYDYVTQLLIGPEAIYTRSLSKNLNTGVVEDIYPWNFQQYKNVINVEAEGSDMAYSCDYINSLVNDINKAKKVVLTGQWVNAVAAHGGGTMLTLPIYNPSGNKPDVSGVTGEYYDEHSSTWKAISTIQVGWATNSFIVLSLDTPVQKYGVLVRLYGTIQTQ